MNVILLRGKELTLDVKIPQSSLCHTDWRRQISFQLFYNSTGKLCPWEKWV